MAIKTLVYDTQISSPTISPAVQITGSRVDAIVSMTITVPANGYIRLQSEFSSDNFATVFVDAVFQIDHRLPFKTQQHTSIFGTNSHAGEKGRINVTDVIGTVTIDSITMEN